MMPRHYISTVERKLSILEAAAHLMVKQGLPEVTMPEVAKASGLSVGGLYRHFVSKEALIHALITADGEAMAQRLGDILNKKTSLEARLTRWSMEQLKREVDADTLKLRLEILAMAARSDSVAAALGSYEEMLLRQLQQLFSEAPKGSLAATDPVQSAAQLCALIDGLATRGAVFSKALKSSRPLIQRTVRSLLDVDDKEFKGG
ncbi:MAG: TetR family transcriptional regulator [Betaproteobacteria bacterium]|nr:TetR family transcriptional regulator [Betaproteobacteria bacterium]